MKKSSEIINLLEKNPDFCDKLFVRGYLITNDELKNIKNDMFFNIWNHVKIDNYHIYYHKKQHLYYRKWASGTVFIIGNCIAPLDNILSEEEILDRLVNDIKKFDEIDMVFFNSLTGNFIFGNINDNSIQFCSDPTGMLFGAYGIIKNNFYLSSHTQLLDDLCGLDKSNYIKKLEKYKYFYKYGLFFPGDLTQFEGLKRIIQNHWIIFDGNSFTKERFYPCKDITIITGEEYENLVKEIADILKKTMLLAEKKWGNNLAVSLTGGMDSKTTLSATPLNDSNIKFYSYISMSGDKNDADAAHTIANKLGIEHKIYNISEDDNDFENIEVVKKIITHNNGGYKINDNDVRKRAFLSNVKDFVVEVKSWVSEIGRANYYKKFGLKKMPTKLTPRHMTSMYKIFTFQRKLAKETDKIFAKFIEETGFYRLPKGYDQSDMYLWEFRYSAWGGMVITSEHSYSNEIFIPFNNRYLLNLMLSAPLEKRISDEFHSDIIKINNKTIEDLGITITNWNETKKRMIIERTYFLIHSFFRIL